MLRLFNKFNIFTDQKQPLKYARQNIEQIQKQSCPKVFCKKGVIRNFTKFTGKYLRPSLFFDKVVGLRPATLLRKRLWHRCFPVNFVKFLRNTFFHKTPLVAAYENTFYTV